MDKADYLRIFAWSLSLLAALVAFIAWGQGVHWQVIGVSSYELFPLFGLIAFSVMWSHYVISAIRQYIRVPKEKLKTYIEVTSWVVLLAIIAHPGLLEWQLWRDGLGLPPGSVLQEYVAPGLRWAALLGMVSLLVFLTYEFRRKFDQSSWWKYVIYATDAAMLAIFVHGMKLGSLLQNGWLKYVWYFYGATLLIALAFIYYYRFSTPKNR
jgi:hypothetical protein